MIELKPVQFYLHQLHLLANDLRGEFRGVAYAKKELIRELKSEVLLDQISTETQLEEEVNDRAGDCFDSLTSNFDVLVGQLLEARHYRCMLYLHFTKKDLTRELREKEFPYAKLRKLYSPEDLTEIDEEKLNAVQGELSKEDARLLELIIEEYCLSFLPAEDKRTRKKLSYSYTYVDREINKILGITPKDLLTLQN